MQTYLVPPDGKSIQLDDASGTREEAISLALKYSSVSGLAGQYRIVVVDEFEVSADESCEVEVFAIGLRHYGDGKWGLTEASASANEVSTDFLPTSNDVALWLRALQDCWQVEPSNVTWAIEEVEAFYVLQLYDGPRLLASITWNAPDADTAFRMPDTLDTPLHLWGDALLVDVGLLYEAVRGVNFASFRK